ncbi:MAG TPA: hypothetical protein PK230_14495, partial [Chitinophagales bacterium]|nr:hypothetical protein [Chitinophagales bacterium]
CTPAFLQIKKSFILSHFFRCALKIFFCGYTFLCLGQNIQENSFYFLRKIAFKSYFMEKVCCQGIFSFLDFGSAKPPKGFFNEAHKYVQ